jgi:hypothetical protein
MNVSEILLQLSKKLKRLSDEELALVQKGRFEIVAVLGTSSSKENKYSTQNGIDKKVDLSDIIEQVKKSTSREESFELLSNPRLTSAHLGKIANHFSITFGSNEKKEHMIKKIIQNTIGFKLNSEAVRGSITSNDKAPEVCKPNSDETPTASN